MGQNYGRLSAIPPRASISSPARMAAVLNRTPVILRHTRFRSHFPSYHLDRYDCYHSYRDRVRGRRFQQLLEKRFVDMFFGCRRWSN